jgi:hypothetical protein
MADSTKEELIRLVANLKDKQPKITWAEVAERVQEEFPKSSGLPLTGNAIRKRYHVWLKKSEDSKRSNNKDQGAEIMSKKPKERLPQYLLAYVEDYIEEYVRPIIERVSVEAAQKVFEEKFSNRSKFSMRTSEGYLPAPPMPDTVAGTRRHTVQRGKLAGTVDSSLLELFESERKVRGFTVSRMLDVVIWNYFSIGKTESPRLSFELSQDPR